MSTPLITSRSIIWPSALITFLQIPQPKTVKTTRKTRKRRNPVVALVTLLPLIVLASLFSTVLCPPPAAEPNSFSKYALNSLGFGKKHHESSLHQTLCYPANQYYTHVLEPYVYPAIEDVRAKVQTHPVYKQHIEPHYVITRDAAHRVWNGPVKPVVDRVSRGANKLYRQYIGPHVPYVKAKFIEATAPLTLHAQKQYNTHLAHHVKLGKAHACTAYKNLKGHYQTTLKHPYTKQAQVHFWNAYGAGKDYSTKAYAYSRPHAEYAYRQGKHHFHNTILPRTIEAIRVFFEYVAHFYRLAVAHTKLFYEEHLAEHLGPHIKKANAAVGPYYEVFTEKVYTPYVAPVVAAIAPHATQAPKTFWQMISDFVPAAGNIAESRGSSFQDEKLNAEAMREAKRQREQVSRAAEQAKKSVESGIKEAKKTASKVSTDARKATDKAKKDAKTAASVAQSYASDVSEGAKTAASSASSYASDVSKGAKTAASSASSYASDASKSARSAASDISKSAKSAASVAQNYASDASRSVETAASSASSYASDASKHAKASASSASKNLKASASSAETQVRRATDAAKQGAASVAENVKASVSSASKEAEKTASTASRKLKASASSASVEAEKATAHVKKEASSASVRAEASASSASIKARASASSASLRANVSGASVAADVKSATDSVKDGAAYATDQAKGAAASAHQGVKDTAEKVKKGAAYVAEAAGAAAAVGAEKAQASASSVGSAAAEGTARAKASVASAANAAAAGTEKAKASVASAADEAAGAAAAGTAKAKASVASAGNAAAAGTDKARASVASAANDAAAGTAKAKASVASAGSVVAESAASGTARAKESVASAGNAAAAGTDKAKASVASAGNAAASGTAKVKQGAKSATRQVKDSAASASAAGEATQANVRSLASESAESAARSIKNSKAEDAKATVVAGEPVVQKVLVEEVVIEEKPVKGASGKDQVKDAKADEAEHGKITERLASLKKDVDNVGRTAYGQVQSELIRAYQKFIDKDIPERQAIGVQSLDREITRMFNGLDRLYSNSKTLTREQVAESVRMSDAKVSKVLDTVRFGVAAYQDRIADPAQPAIADAKSQLYRLETEVEALGKRLTADSSTSNREWAAYKAVKRDLDDWKKKIDTNEPSKKLKEVQQKAKVAIAEVQTEFDELFGGWREHRDRIRQVALDRIEARETVAKEKGK